MTTTETIENDLDQTAIVLEAAFCLWQATLDKFKVLETRLTEARELHNEMMRQAEAAKGLPLAHQQEVAASVAELRQKIQRTLLGK